VLHKEPAAPALIHRTVQENAAALNSALAKRFIPKLISTLLKSMAVLQLKTEVILKMRKEQSFHP